jgi:hypothetical protein
MKGHDIVTIEISARSLEALGSLPGDGRASKRGEEGETG